MFKSNFTNCIEKSSKLHYIFFYAIFHITKVLQELEVKLSILATKFYFHVFSLVCHLLRSGVAALFGPQSGTTSSHVQSICDAMEIPHIETRWDYRLKRDDYSVNLYPHPTAISKVRRKKNVNSFC